MLTGRKFVFLGGDARQLEVIRQVTEMDASATLVGYDNLGESFLDTQLMPMSENVLADADAVVLPVAGMDNDGKVDTRFADEPLHLEPEHFAAMRPGTFVFSGIAGERLQSYCEEHQLRLVKLMELDEVAILNSIPTAEGAIALAMQHTDITIHGANVSVLGFGRCGKTLARILSAMGANVKVSARDPANEARIYEMGFTPISSGELDGLLGQDDIIFNTIPHPVLTASVLATVNKSCVVIDIASKPGGTDFRYAERRGIKAVLAPSLPGLVAPKTAGRIIGNTICRLLALE
ncbi:dipicolinate synthase subunit DpsA [Alicyclobacillus ferrooxydans]|uniref:Dipicolinate synthase subunit A n=1 Tax=Alicyclobacillus ferrooxydans TaxID=471514 RepID=A0A0P9CT47_9BACL|nr:dipicolinate synthase subunit DpsA [Alicyclobacillus ferrooxydans]KPV39838.1 dipicolinate synthase subunit A [Alicyclobacillus ferrooxydans]